MGVKTSALLTWELGLRLLLAPFAYYSSKLGCQGSNLKRQRNKNPTSLREREKYFCCDSLEVTGVQIGKQLKECLLSLGWHEMAEVRQVNASCEYLCQVPTCVGKSNSCFMEDLVLMYSVFAKCHEFIDVGSVVIQGSFLNGIIAQNVVLQEKMLHKMFQKFGLLMKWVNKAKVFV